MGLAARAAAGPPTKVSTPCYIGQFLAWLPPAEAAALNDMLNPESKWSNVGIAEAINEDYTNIDHGVAVTPLNVAGVSLRADEDGNVSDGMVGRHRRKLRGRRASGCKCEIGPVSE
jgi:hypothetical protein